MNELIARAAYINAQVVCAQAEIEAMKAANLYETNQGKHIVYGEADFKAIPDKYGIHHNAVIGYLTNV